MQIKQALTLPALAFAALTLAAPLPALAQATTQEPAMAAEELTEGQLDSFVAAAERVGEITQELRAEAQGVQDEAALAEMQQEAQADMLAAVEDEGLSVDEYNAIVQIAQNDPELNAQLRERMQQ